MDIIASNWTYFVADTLAHVGIAGIVTSFVILRDWTRSLFWGGLALILAKEGFFDLPNGDWMPLVWFDSVWDVFSWWAGFAFQWWALMAPRKGEVEV